MIWYKEIILISEVIFLSKDVDIIFTTRDKLIMAWEKSMDLTRTFTDYSHNIEGNDEVKNTFKELSEKMGHQSAVLRDMLLKLNK